MNVIDRIVSRVGRRIDESSPLADARLAADEHHPLRGDPAGALRVLERSDGIDATRLGAWGISYSGGHVLQLAATDPRVAALVRLRRESAIATVLVEQQVEIALEMTQRALVLDKGQIVWSGVSADLASDPRVREAYLGSVEEGHA